MAEPESVVLVTEGGFVKCVRDHVKEFYEQSTRLFLEREKNTCLLLV